MDRFTANYGIGRLNPEDAPTYNEQPPATTTDQQTPATRDGQQAAD